MTLDARVLEEWGELFAALAVAAGATLLEIKGSGIDVRAKSDGSPVTQADEKAEAVILTGLAQHDPGMPVVAEELSASGAKICAQNRFILVDPLDGTREFLSGRPDYTVNIALIEAGVPVCGVVYAPELNRLWSGASHNGRNQAACASVPPGGRLPAPNLWTRIEARQRPEKNWICLASRSHPDPNVEALIAHWPVGTRIEAGSSLKFCKIAEGLADVYPRCASIMEWDTAAGDAVLRGAGGIVVDPAGRPLLYGKKDWRNSPFVAWGKGGPAVNYTNRHKLRP